LANLTAQGALYRPCNPRAAGALLTVVERLCSLIAELPNYYSLNYGYDNISHVKLNGLLAISR